MNDTDYLAAFKWVFMQLQENLISAGFNCSVIYLATCSSKNYLLRFTSKGWNLTCVWYKLSVICEQNFYIVLVWKFGSIYKIFECKSSWSFVFEDSQLKISKDYNSYLAQADGKILKLVVLQVHSVINANSVTCGKLTKYHRNLSVIWGTFRDPILVFGIPVTWSSFPTLPFGTVLGVPYVGFFVVRRVL